jgi:hypothetical protein
LGSRSCGLSLCFGKYCDIYISLLLSNFLHCFVHVIIFLSFNAVLSFFYQDTAESLLRGVFIFIFIFFLSLLSCACVKTWVSRFYFALFPLLNHLPLFRLFFLCGILEGTCPPVSLSFAYFFSPSLFSSFHFTYFFFPSFSCDVELNF